MYALSRLEPPCPEVVSVDLARVAPLGSNRMSYISQSRSKAPKGNKPLAHPDGVD